MLNYFNAFNIIFHDFLKYIMLLQFDIHTLFGNNYKFLIIYSIKRTKIKNKHLFNYENLAIKLITFN
jgi:hypothetical protein